MKHLLQDQIKSGKKGVFYFYIYKFKNYLLLDTEFANDLVKKKDLRKPQSNQIKIKQSQIPSVISKK